MQSNVSRLVQRFGGRDHDTGRNVLAVILGYHPAFPCEARALRRALAAFHVNVVFFMADVQTLAVKTPIVASRTEKKKLLLHPEMARA